MLDNIRINYRDFDESSFDIYNRDINAENKYRSLLNKALKARPNNDFDNELLGDYISVLRQIVLKQSEINQIREQILCVPHTNASRSSIIKALEEQAKHCAACIYSREQELCVLEMSYGKRINDILGISNQNATPAKQSKPAIKKDIQNRPSLSKKNKYLIVCLSVLCLLAVVISLISAVKIDFAVDHYEVTKQRNSWWYGCRIYECEYCRGRGVAKTLTEFVYYRNLLYVRNTSVVVAVVSGVSTLGLGVFMVKNKKDS